MPIRGVLQQLTKKNLLHNFIFPLFWKQQTADPIIWTSEKLN